MYYLGFDIGGTKCALSLGKVSDGEIEVVKKEQISTLKSPVETLDELFGFARGWLSEFDVKYAGVSCGGPLDSKSGRIISPPNLSEEWYGFGIADYISKALGVSVILENDANACAVAEWKFGAGKGADNVIFMTFGTGLGAGLILDGRLYSGTNGNAGEVGHVRLEDDGPVGFNKAGSAEGFCSGGGILRLAHIRAKEQNISLPDTLTTKDIFEKARQKDTFFLSVINESAEQFARVLSILIDLFNPEVIIAGGVFMRNYDLFMPRITPIVERESLADSRKVCRILPAKIGEQIGDLAALALAVMESEKNENIN